MLPVPQDNKDRECFSSKMEDTSWGKRSLAIGSRLEENRVGFTTVKDPLWTVPPGKDDAVVTAAVIGRCCRCESRGEKMTRERARDVSGQEPFLTMVRR